MGIPINLEDLLGMSIVESTRIEFKEGFNPEPIIHSICAFANDIDNIGGGYIVVGAKEEHGVLVRPVTGVEPSSVDSILKKLREYCHFIEPLYEPVAEPVPCDGKIVILIYVAGGHGRPYKAPKNISSQQSYKYYYIRKFSSSVIASSDEEKELFYVSSNIPFDDRPNLLASTEDLSLGLMREHLKEIKSSLYVHSSKMSLEDIAESLQLVGGPPEGKKPLNVGILMFSEHPEKYFRYAKIEVVDIPDPTGTNMTEKIFAGPIQRQLKDALQFLKNYVLKEAVVKSGDRAESERIMNYPFPAIEEILSNAVYHRSYQINEPITVRITPEKIEITSYPGFDRSITDEAIQKGDLRARIYRNRRIGDFLKELKLIEGRNTGFPNAKQALARNGSPDLVLEMNPERDFLSVSILIHPFFDHSKKKEKIYRETIINKLREREMTLTELAVAMEYKGITEKLRKNVRALENEGKLKKIAQNNKLRYTVAP